MTENNSKFLMTVGKQINYFKMIALPLPFFTGRIESVVKKV